MSDWIVSYYHTNNAKKTIEHWFDGLTNEQFKSVAKEIKLLECCGNQLRLPHSRSLGSSLFELRERKYGYRIYYSFSSNHEIILLHAGDKASQERDIKVARSRLAKT